jgi:hypothetical protein
MGYELESITLVDLATGKRIQCPDHHVDWPRLVGPSDHEQESHVVPPSEPRQRSALGGQTKHRDWTAESLSLDQPAQYSALRGCLPPSAGPGRAAAAQLQTVGTRPSGTQIGQEA